LPPNKGKSNKGGEKLDNEQGPRPGPGEGPIDGSWRWTGGPNKGKLGPQP